MSKLGDLLRQQGVPVGAPSPAPPTGAPSVDPVDFGGAPKIVLRRETKGRGGKTATVIEGLRLPPSALERIARELRCALGCGAATEGNTIVVQGDMSARLEPWFTARGARRVVLGN
ncbi:MAG: translation initiation factor [Candidatus Binatia bacterium]